MYSMLQGGARMIGQGGGPHPQALGPPGGPQFPAQGDGPQGPQQGIYGEWNQTFTEWWMKRFKILVKSIGINFRSYCSPSWVSSNASKALPWHWRSLFFVAPQSFSHHSGAVHQPQPSSTPTGNQPPPQHAAPSPGQVRYPYRTA